MNMIHHHIFKSCPVTSFDLPKTKKKLWIDQSFKRKDIISNPEYCVSIYKVPVYFLRAEWPVHSTPHSLPCRIYISLMFKGS